MATGYLFHEVFGWHDTGTSVGLLGADPRLGLQPWAHYENADTKRRIHELVVVSGLIDRLARVAPRPVTREELLRVHGAAHIDRMRAASDAGGGDMGDGGSPFGPGAYDIAALSCGGAIEMLKAVVEGRVDNGYALIRPPGHHARPDTGMGFCMFANASVAVRAIQADLGVSRIAIVDWDVHHGNGAEEIFWDDPSVLTVSVHQDNLFPPDSGAIADRGGAGAPGSAVNIPLPPGTGNAGYLAAMSEVIVPALERFGPELIVVSSGFDASSVDPLSQQMVTAGGYRDLTRLLMEAADRLCDGRIAMLHEGGYSPAYTPFCGLATVEALAGAEPFPDPFDPMFSGSQQPLQPHQADVVRAAADAALSTNPSPLGETR